MDCLVTGGAGFIGSNLVDALIARGDSVAVLDSLVTGKRENLNAAATFYELDVRDRDGVQAVFDEVKPQVIKALTDASFNGTRDTHAYAQVIRRTVGRWVNTQHRRRPMIIPVVIEA